jgi:hypothetical protein
MPHVAVHDGRTTFAIFGSKPPEQYDYAIEFIEAALMMIAYITYLDLCAYQTMSDTKMFKRFQQRSAGYLWSGAKILLQRSELVFAKPF